MTIAGCSVAGKSNSPATQRADAVATQKTYASAKEAAQALVDAVQSGNEQRNREIFGAAYQEMVTGNREQDARNLRNFAGRTREGWQVVEISPTYAKIVIGEKKREFPIPLIADKQHQWRFDTASGVKAIREHRIERNETETARVCLAYVEAQKEYAALRQDRAGLQKFAERIKSTPGSKDGLYWTPEPDQAPSPMGPMIAGAEVEATPNLIGPPTTRPAAESFHGYQFKILKRQGSSAAGGAYSYVIHGNMVSGFALVAWPAVYGQSGVHTFIINQNGKLYQRDLGASTGAIASRMDEFNPEKGWEISTPPAE